MEEVVEETKELLLKGTINSAADKLMRFIYDYSLEEPFKRVNRKIIQETTEMGKKFLECFRKEENQQVIERVVIDKNLRDTNPLLKQLFV